MNIFFPRKRSVSKFGTSRHSPTGIKMNSCFFFVLWTLFVKADAREFQFFVIFEQNKICQKLRNEKINRKFSMLTTRSYFQQAI